MQRRRPPSSESLPEVHHLWPAIIGCGLLTQPYFSIVAVHGLGDDAINTWTHPKSKAFWLQDFLPKQIPDARIMTFGYNAAVAFGQSTAEVIDHAKSLLASLVDKREELEVQSTATYGANETLTLS